MTQQTTTFPAAREACAAETEAAVGDLVAFIENCGDADWDKVSTAEGWPVRVLAHHLAEGFAVAESWLDYMRRGEAVPGTLDSINAENADHARRAAGVGREETAAVAEENGERAVAQLRSLTEDEWQKSAPFGPGNGMELTVEYVAGANVRHFNRHMESIRQAISA